jgi:hypothetical protein
MFDDGLYFQEREVPVNQGIFVLNVKTSELFLIARTGEGSEFEDFVFWNYSGAPPGAGNPEEDDREPPRFRSSAFLSVSLPPDQLKPDDAKKHHKWFQRWREKKYGKELNKGKVAFKARKANATDGIYLKAVSADTTEELVIVAEQGMESLQFDPAAVLLPNGTGSLLVDEVAIERDALRGQWLVVTIGFGGEYLDDQNEVVEVDFAGIYATTLY